MEVGGKKKKGGPSFLTFKDGGFAGWWCSRPINTFVVIFGRGWHLDGSSDYGA